MKILSKYFDFVNESKLPQQVDKDIFLKKEKEFKREKFTTREIFELNKINFEEKYLIPLQKIEEGYISDSILFDTQCGLFYIIIIKLEDEWYLIEERPRKVMLDTKYFICDGFNHLIDYINNINEKFK